MGNVLLGLFPRLADRDGFFGSISGGAACAFVSRPVYAFAASHHGLSKGNGKLLTYAYILFWIFLSVFLSLGIERN